MSSGLYSGVSGLALGIGLYRNVSGLWGGASGLIDGFGGSDPYAGASLYLNFLNPELDPRITFSRGTNATLIDSTGKLTYAPNNQLLNSVLAGGTAGVLGAGAAPPTSWGFPLNTGSISYPPALFGGGTAARFVAVAQRPFINFNLSAAANTRYIYSAYVDAIASGSPALQDLVAYNAGGLTVTPAYYVNGVLVTATTTAVAGTRIVLVLDVGSTAGTINIRLGLGGAGAVTADATMSAPQVEQVTYQTAPSTYVATTASAYYGPRFDYDPVTLAPRGLLIEEARTNLLTYSEQFDNAAWVKSNATVSANSIIAPDGMLTADTLVSSVTNTAKHISQSGIASTVATFTVYAKAAGETTLSLWLVGASVGAIFTLTGSGSTTLNGATSSSIQQLANGWYRCSVYSSSATTTAHIYLRNGSGYVGDGTSGIYLYGAQLEAGSFATSYIPTVASTVTRNADVAIMTGTNFSSWYNQPEGTLVVDADTVTGASNRVVELSAGSTTRVVDLLMSAPFLQMFNGTSAFNATGNVPLNTPFKAAGAYRTGNYGVVLNGAAVTTNTDALVNTANALQIGRFSSGSNYLNGHIRTIAYFNTRLPNAQLQTLTAPSLATTLSLDFTSGSYNVGF